jgi:hypothetical protein
MKKLLFALSTAALMFVVFGCSNSGDLTAPQQEQAIVLVERPEFIDLRPTSVIEEHLLTATMQESIWKKPPPDTGGTGGDDPNPNPPHKYAYVVGISDYEGTVNDLQFCDEDAAEMISYLRSQGFTIRSDVDRNATAAAIEAGLQWLVASAVPGDEIAFCYSGHGAKAPGYGSSIISTDLYYVTHGFVMSYINQANCSKKLVTLDACVIGDFHSDVVTGTVMATASTNCNSYDAPDLNNGAWTYFFLEGAEDQGMPYAEDIASYAESEMKAWAKMYRLRVCPAHTDAYTGSFDI